MPIEHVAAGVMTRNISSIQVFHQVYRYSDHFGAAENKQVGEFW
jgi:hypothetical protein